MKRFIKVYLTLLVVVLLATNLVLVLAYGKQFLYSAADGLTEADTVVKSAVIYLNLVVLAIFVLFWLIAHYFYRGSKKDSSNQR